MKVLTFLCCTLVVLSGCGKTADESDRRPMPLSLERRTTAAVEWNEFKNASDDGLHAAQKKIDDLRAKIYLATVTDKVKIRRIINKNEYRLEKLRKELYDHDAWLEDHIGTFTAGNASKIERFKKYFDEELAAVNTEINNCGC